MLEMWPEQEVERERHVTRAQIMHELNHALNRGMCRIDMTSEGNVSGWLSELLGQSSELSEWTDDIFDAFKVSKTDWRERVVDQSALGDSSARQTANQQDLGEYLRTQTYAALANGLSQGRFDNNAVTITLGLNDTIQADFCGNAQAWGSAADPDYELNFWALIRRVA